MQVRSISPPFNHVFTYFRPLCFSSAEPLPLMDLCRRAARLALGRERLKEIRGLPLPQSLKDYLQYKWLTAAERTQTSHRNVWMNDGRIRCINVRRRHSSAKDGFIQKRKKNEELTKEVQAFQTKTAPDYFGFRGCFIICFIFFYLK